ncbi:9-O-acetylesterase [candidate division KSB1 bacterium]|nr:9-O-acetylesterase [candidate division KSB1 bacterium]
MKRLLCTTLLLLSLSATLVLAEVTLPKIIGSNMVLQRDSKIPVWGWADKGEKITVTLNGNTVKVKADKSGQWRADLPPMPAGGPYDMIITGKNTITLSNILLGDVWICSGQSNMQWTVFNSNNAEQEIMQADYPKMRLFSVPRVTSTKPLNDIESGEWSDCSPKSISNFSAVGYFFGRSLHKSLNVPIGLIHTSWGGTMIETWISGPSIKTIKEFTEVVGKVEQIDGEKFTKEITAKYEKILKEFDDSKGGLIDGKALWAAPDLDESNWKEMPIPGLWEQRGLKELDGVVWFRLTIDLTEEAIKDNMVLHLGKIDDSDITWINGVKVGETENKYNELRHYKIDAGVFKAGKNVITVRVVDTGGGGGLWSDDADLYLEAGDIKKSLAGTWKYRISPVDLKFEKSGIAPNDYPTLLYNAMIFPLLPYAVKGAIWYQGEANAGRAFKYRELMPLMIKDWRVAFENPDMPFFIVQLANYMAAKPEPSESEWAELREAQLLTVLNVPNTGLAVTIDIGEADDIHPRNKQDVGKRLALAARKVAYGQELVFSGPTYKSMAIDGDKIVLSFENTGGGLMAKDKYGYLKGFTIAGDDGKFVWAKAAIDGNRIIVYNEQVKNPVAVRYAWADNPDDANFYNAEDLPASPFRTDDWPGLTWPKQD